MTDLLEILAACDDAATGGRPAVLATVVRVTGSAYRRPGARMLLRDDGTSIGMVSGGCLESDLADRAARVLESGQPRTVTYDMRSPDDIVWGLGLGCEGEVRVLLERLDPGARPPYLGFLEENLRRRRPTVLATVFDRGGAAGPEIGSRVAIDAASTPEPWAAPLLEEARACLASRRSAVRTSGAGDRRIDVLFEYVAPPVHLLVFGAGADALPLVRLAGELGWITTVADHRAAFARAKRFPRAKAVLTVRFDRLGDTLSQIDARTPAIVMTHHFLHDLEILRFLVETDCPYVGLLGPRRRTEKLLRELRTGGVEPTPDQRDRLYGPAGIDIGSETPEEIALAVLAEIQAVLSGRPAGLLRHREGPLHEWSDESSPGTA